VGRCTFSLQCVVLNSTICLTSSADSMGHGGTCPHFYKWLGTGGTASRKNSKQETDDQTVLTVTKPLSKTTNCAFRAKKWRGKTPKKISGASLRIGAPPPLLLRTGAPTFIFIPAPLCLTTVVRGSSPSRNTPSTIRSGVRLCSRLPHSLSPQPSYIHEVQRLQ